MVISRESFKDSDGDKMMIIMYNGDHIQSFIILRERERERERLPRFVPGRAELLSPLSESD